MHRDAWKFRFKGVLVAASLSIAACATLAEEQPVRVDAPKLIVVISVDQLSADLWDEYRSHFTGGLARLSEGTVFRNGFQSHAATETCPGHSTILTGRQPASNGIIANAWLGQSEAGEVRTIYCAGETPGPGSPAGDLAVSPDQMRAPTFGDLLKAVSPTSRNVAVAGKDRSAVMMSGHSADQRWYWSGDQFVSDLENATVPRSVVVANAELVSALAQPRAALVPPPICINKARVYELAPGRTVGANALGRPASDQGAFRASPELDEATLALSAAIIQEMRLGHGQTTDIISVGLSATDYVGHAYGSGGQEMCLQLLALDRMLDDFLIRLDRAGIDYLVMLTADHGGMDIPERLRDRGLNDAARVDPALAAREVSGIVSRRLGLAGPVLFGAGAAGDSWIDPRLSAADSERVLAEVLAIYRAHPQVYGAYSKADIAGVAMPTGDPRTWSIPQRLRASFDPVRSGDVMVVLRPNISPVAAAGEGDAATHGSPWDYNRRVPIIFWRNGMPARAIEAPAQTVDIMPTLASMVGLQSPGGLQGRCLNGVLGSRCPR